MRGAVGDGWRSWRLPDTRVSRTPVVLSWSGGKDSCVALHQLQSSGDYDVTALLTTMTPADDRIAVHRVRRELLVRQAASLGLPLDEVPIPSGASNVVYEAAMARALDRHRACGTTTIAFGDLFLADIRAYRETMMTANGMASIFPVWGQDTRTFIAAFIDAGFRAVIVCVDLVVLDASFAGRAIDHALIADLPAGVDPCGENGEFHTFVFDGPNFAEPVLFHHGDRFTRGGFCYQDLVSIDD